MDKKKQGKGNFFSISSVLFGIFLIVGGGVLVFLTRFGTTYWGFRSVGFFLLWGLASIRFGWIGLSTVVRYREPTMTNQQILEATNMWLKEKTELPSGVVAFSEDIYEKEYDVSPERIFQMQLLALKNIDQLRIWEYDKTDWRLDASTTGMGGVQLYTKVSGIGATKSKLTLYCQPKGTHVGPYFYDRLADLRTAPITGSFSSGQYDWVARMIFGELEKIEKA